MGIAIYTPGADYSSLNFGQITLVDNVLPTALTIHGVTNVLGNAQYTCSFEPVFTKQRGIVWSITSGGSYATIDQSGRVIADISAEAQSVTIRATSSADSSVYAEKTITVTGIPVVYYDWLKNNDTAFIEILTSGISNLDTGALLVSFVTIPEGGNTYIFSTAYSTGTGGATGNQAYLSSDNKISYKLGGSSYKPLTRTTGMRYRYEFDMKGYGDSTSVVRIYNDATDTLLHTSSEQRQSYINGDIGLFCWYVNDGGKGHYGSSGLLNMTGKIYSFNIKKNGTDILNLRPCTANGIGAMIDTVSGHIYYNANSTGSFSYGNDE